MCKRKGLIAVFLTVLMVSALCLWLYDTDNKYTREDLQPINGVLFYAQNRPYSYLTRQWLIYPDVLLEPGDIDGYSGYRYYGDIGGSSGDGKGCMTYRLTIHLPNELREYALELPEVFSACKLYVNDRLCLQLGDPSAANYREGMASRIVTFSAQGETELLLAVSDRSGVNRGMTYPPAFGMADAVLKVREIRLFLHGAFVLLALLGALLSASFGLYGQRQNGILSCLLCLCFAVVTGYPLYHGMLTTEVQPWYTIEPVCYYALLLLALLLQASLYSLETRYRLLLAAPCIAGLMVTMICFGGAAVLPDSTAGVFSFVAAILKYYTALCLLVLSLWGLWQEKPHSVLLLCGSSALAVCLVWDRLKPLYEPVYGGWFGEIGGGVLVISLAAALWLEAMDAYRFRLTYEANFHHMERMLTMQKEHYTQLSEQIQLTREASHDLRHHMRTLRGLADQQQWFRLENYLKEYEAHARERDFFLWSDHPAANAVLNHYAETVKGKNVSYDVRLAIPADIPLPDDELCIILGNLMENAVDAVLAQRHGVRKIYLRGEFANGRMGIVLDNTYTGELKQKNGVFLSTKHPGQGLGIRSVTTTVKKYRGLIDISADKERFHTSILIPFQHNSADS